MKRFLTQFRKNCKGAVTVFVTLLLIPAVLLSGTGVDLARAYTIESLLHDANQLAANSVLTEYDALLQDLYGLYGIMADDPELANMVNSYIELTVLEEDAEKGMGTFQVFYGGNQVDTELTPAPEKHLGDPAVIRRQIEEYAKFRAPVFIAEEIFTAIEQFKKTKQDAEVIRKKMDIDDKIDEIDKIYKKIYDSIQDINSAKAVEESILAEVNATIQKIEEEFDHMYVARDDYTLAMEDKDDEMVENYNKKYTGYLKNIQSLVTGGTFRDGWWNGGVDTEGHFQMGEWNETTQIEGLSKKLEDSRKELQSAKEKLEDLKALCEQAQNQKTELERLVREMEEKLESGVCSAAMSDGLTKASDGNSESLMDSYRRMLAYDVEKMGTAVYQHNHSQLQQTMDMLENDIGYGNESVGVFAHLETIEKWSVNSDFPIDVQWRNNHSSDKSRSEDKLGQYDGVTPKKYSLPGSFESFESQYFSATKNPQFYDMLKEMYQTSASGVKAENMKQGLNEMMGEIQDYYKALMNFVPEGAFSIGNGSGGAENDVGNTVFGTEGDWSRGSNVVKESIDDRFISQIGHSLENAGNHILLLTYATEMFSCFSTGKRADTPVEKTMNGIPMGVQVNYFYQSELEYLFHGNEKNAVENLAAVSGMILLTRFVMNYVASFSINSVNATVNSVKISLSWAGPIGIAVGELARLAIALGESVIDVGRLIQGDKVALIKTNTTWQFSINGLINTATGTVNSIAGSQLSGKANDDLGTFNLGYKDYLRLFLLMKNGDVLAQRVSRLIAINVTNVKEQIGSQPDRVSRQNAMAQADQFDMTKAITDFSITSTVTMRMLFLSMPFARKGVNGTVPPGSLEISITDYRGY